MASKRTAKSKTKAKASCKGCLNLKGVKELNAPHTDRAGNKAGKFIFFDETDKKPSGIAYLNTYTLSWPAPVKGWLRGWRSRKARRLAQRRILEIFEQVGSMQEVRLENGIVIRSLTVVFPTMPGKSKS